MKAWVKQLERVSSVFDRESFFSFLFPFQTVRVSAGALVFCRPAACSGPRVRWLHSLLVGAGSPLVVSARVAYSLKACIGGQSVVICVFWRGWSRILSRRFPETSEAENLL